MPIDTVDLTDLKKRGLLKETKETNPEPTEYMDFSSPNPQQTQTPTESTNPLAFLDTFAANASPTPSASPSSTDNQDLNIKLENLEYKLERLTEKLVLIESKLSNFEDKII